MSGCFSFTTLRFFQSLYVRKKPYPNSTRASFFSTFPQSIVVYTHCPCIVQSCPPLTLLCPPHRLTSLPSTPTLFDLFHSVPSAPTSLSYLPALLPHTHTVSLVASFTPCPLPTFTRSLTPKQIKQKLQNSYRNIHSISQFDTFCLDPPIFVDHLQLDKLSSYEIEGRMGGMAFKTHEF